MHARALHARFRRVRLHWLWAVVLAAAWTHVRVAAAPPAPEEEPAPGRVAPASAERPAPGEAAEPAPPARSEDETTVATLFEDFLHYARLGRFQEARAFATSLLERPDLDPVALVALADRDRKTLDTLVTVVNNSSIGPEAQRVLDVLREGEARQRQNAQRINANIEKLSGPPQTEYNAIQSLIDSGEYAVPWMVRVLMDRNRQALWPRVIRALPQIGQPAVNPLVVALRVEDRDLRLIIIRVLGELGYPHALPYLQQLLLAPDLTDETRAALTEAQAKIERRTGRRATAAAAEQFVDLGEQYYSETGSLRADPRTPTANVWFWRDGFVEAAVVRRELYGPIMAMRCAEEALRLEPAGTPAMALWLAADTRREARLGMDVESGEIPADSADPTRPADFPRALYFSQAAGTRYALAVLDRALRDQDTPVALGAIASLRGIAGEGALLGSPNESRPLVKALQFPDAVVRIKAALALAAVRPKSQFPGSERVVPVLAEALGQTGTMLYVVLDPDQANLNRMVEALRGSGAEVIGDTDFFAGLERARRETRALSGIFLSTGMETPGVRRALSELRREFLFRMTPIVLLRGPADDQTARELVEQDSRITHVEAGADGATLVEAMRRAMAQSGRLLPNPEVALRLALEAADALRGLGGDGRTVLNVGAAESALRSALTTANSEDLRRKAALALSLLGTPAAQRALADAALDGTQAGPLRQAVLGALAESAKLNGNLLGEAQIGPLVKLSADEPDLVLRTAASQALGALNLTDRQASEIIRKYYRG